MENISDIDRTLNLIVQGKMIEGYIGEWFMALPAETKQAILFRIVFLCLQAGATDQDAKNAIIASGLKKTYTPCILLSVGNIKMQLSKIVNLPESEWLKAYKLIMALMKIADDRRRNTECRNGCTHWWHQL